MSNEKQTIDPVADALRNLNSIAKRIDMQRMAGVEPLFCTAQVDGRDLEWIDNAVAFLKKVARCPECDKRDVSVAVTCHNSKCRQYAEDRTVYEGWK